MVLLNANKNQRVHIIYRKTEDHPQTKAAVQSIVNMKCHSRSFSIAPPLIMPLSSQVGIKIMNYYYFTCYPCSLRHSHHFLCSSLTHKHDNYTTLFAFVVTLTMTLSALSVIFVNNEETIQNGEEELAAAYQVFDTENATGSEKLTLSLLNTLIMVCVIACMTFVIVFLYKFRFMKVLIGYMMFSSACLLGVLGGNLWYTAIEIYRWAVDKFTFTMAVYNFCIVGVISIFWAKGVPTFVTQGYLVATSVILAWQLAHFDACTFLKCCFLGPRLYYSYASELTRQS